MSSIDFRRIKQLWMFLAVAEEEHFGRAARRLGISQPPLTEQIKALEHSLKLQLFERSRRGTRLSPAGAALLPAVRQFADQLAQLERTVGEIAAGHSAVLNIGAITSAMLETMPPLLEELKRIAPGVTVFIREIDSVEALPALESGELDLAFVRLEGNVGQHIATLPLEESRLAVAMPIDHPLAKLSRISFRALAAEPLVMPARQVSPAWFDLLISACRQHGFIPRVLHEVRSVSSQIAFVSCGQGVALVPASTRRLAPANVVVKTLAEKQMVVTAAAAWNTRRSHPLVAAAIAWLTSRDSGLAAHRAADARSR